MYSFMILMYPSIINKGKKNIDMFYHLDSLILFSGQWPLYILTIYILAITMKIKFYVIILIPTSPLLMQFWDS